MGIPVLILGESGSGKSASLRNFTPEEISIFNVAGKPLPFRKKLPKVKTSDYRIIMAGLQKSQKKSFAIDDSQYLLCFEMFDHAKETGYQKFTDMALPLPRIRGGDPTIPSLLCIWVASSPHTRG